MTKIFNLVGTNTKETTKSKSETKLTGLTGRFKQRPTMIDYVLQIEKLWERYALELDTMKKEQHLEKLLKEVSKVLKGKAKAAGAQWNNSRLSAADFEISRKHGSYPITTIIMASSTFTRLYYLY